MNPRDSTRWKLEQALPADGCAICRVSHKAVRHFLDGLLYESVNDPGVRRHVTHALGFCNRHAWQMRALQGNALGVAMLHRDALDQWQKQLADLPKPKANTNYRRYQQRVVRANQPAAICLACQKQAESERRCVDVLTESLPDPNFVEALRRSAGLCRPHFAQVCAASSDSVGLDTLVEIQTEINRRLIGELDEFIRKSDYRFMPEGFGVEGDSWIRAIEHLSGAEGAMDLTK